MSKVSHEQDVSVLSSNKNGLVYLTANDWALIVDKASRMKFKAGEHVVKRGRRTHGLFLLLKGTAALEIPPGPERTIAAGEACGEISFLDDLPATANVIANDAVEAFYLDRATLQSLFELFPHLGSRFYHSLAVILSHRLRAVIEPSAFAKANSAQKGSI